MVFDLVDLHKGIPLRRLRTFQQTDPICYPTGIELRNQFLQAPQFIAGRSLPKLAKR